MQLDFAAEYARRSDDELRLLLEDRSNLLPVAQAALDTEIAKRQRHGFQAMADDDDLVQVDPEQKDQIVVYSRSLTFPPVCPNCAGPAHDHVKISCASDSLSAFFPMIRLWRYLFCRYRVPFCGACAYSLSLRRWLERTYFFVVIAVAIYVAKGFHSPRLVFLLTTGILYLLGAISSWSSEERRIRFANPEYQTAFAFVNGMRKERGQRS